MIDFTLTVTVCEADHTVENALDRLYKKEKIQWPVLPREGEWFEITDLDSATANPVQAVWHWSGDDGTPNIQVEIDVRSFEFEELAALPGWTDRQPR